MPSETKFSRLIFQLIQATVDKKLKWRVADPPRSATRGTDDVIPFFLRAVYKGQQLAVFERRYTSYDGEHDSTYWVADDVFAILDHKEDIIWEHREGLAALADLIKVARESAANVDGILDILLEEEL